MVGIECGGLSVLQIKNWLKVLRPGVTLLLETHCLLAGCSLCCWELHLRMLENFILFSLLSSGPDPENSSWGGAA